MPLFGKRVGNISKYGSIPEWASGDLLKPIADELIKYAAPISDLDGERPSLNLSAYSKNERKIACKTGWVIMNKFQRALIEKAKLERDLQLAQEKLLLTEECLKSVQTKTKGDLIVSTDKGSELYRACPVTVTETQWKLSKDCVGKNGMHEDAHTEVKEVFKAFTRTELNELVMRHKQKEGESLADWILRIFDNGADCVFLNASEVVCMGQLTLHPQVRNALRRVRSVRGNVPLLDFIRGALVNVFPFNADLEPTSPCITMQEVIHRVRIMGCVVGLNAENWEGPDMEDFTACMRTRLLKCLPVQMKISIFSLLSGLGKTGKIHQLTSLLAEMVELNTPTNVCKTNLMEKKFRNECKNYKLQMSRQQVWHKLLRAGVCKNEIDGIPTAELIKRWNTIRAKTDRASLTQPCQPWSNSNKQTYSRYPRHLVPLHEKSSWWRAPPSTSRGPDSHECKGWGSDWKQKQNRAFVSVDGRMAMPLGKPSVKRGVGAGCTDAAPVKMTSDTKVVAKSETHVTVPPELLLGNGYLGRDSANSVSEKCSPVVHLPTMPVSQMQNRLPERCLGEQTVHVNPKHYRFTNKAAKEEKTPPALQDNKPADIPEPVREMGNAKTSPTQRTTLSTIDSHQSPAKSTSLKGRQSDQIQRNCERDFILSGHDNLMEKSKQKACSTCVYVEKWHLTNKGQEDCAAQRFGHGQETDLIDANRDFVLPGNVNARVKDNVERWPLTNKAQEDCSEQRTGHGQKNNLIASRDANHHPAKETAPGDTEMTTCSKASQKPVQMDYFASVSESHNKQQTHDYHPKANGSIEWTKEFSKEQICALSLLGPLWGWDGYKKHPFGNISPNETLLNSLNAMVYLCFTGWSLVNHISQKLVTDMSINQT